MSYSLRELEAYFVRYQKTIAGEGHSRPLPDGTRQYGGFETDVMMPVQSLSEAQGIMFLCPLCFQKNNGPVGTHSVSVSFEGRGVLPEQGSHSSDGAPSRWNVVGSGLDDLQLTPSVAINTGAPDGPEICKWHGWVGSSGIPPGHAG